MSMCICIYGCFRLNRAQKNMFGFGYCTGLLTKGALWGDVSGYASRYESRYVLGYVLEGSNMLLFMNS